MPIGVAGNYFNEGLDPEIKEAVDNAVSLFVKLGAKCAGSFPPG
jgi:hypothetical protein